MPAKFLTARWRHLAMLNFEVDPVVLAPHLPRGTELDDRDGHHFVSLVGFLFLETHIFGVPAFFHEKFEEVNLRFYVRRKVGEDTHHGVVFIRELVPLPLVTEAAKLTYNEPYRTVPMRHSIVETSAGLKSVEYKFGDPVNQCRISVRTAGTAKDMARASLEEFLSERPWGYTRQRDGGTIQYHVDHPRWKIWSDTQWELEGRLAEFYDEPFAAILGTHPASVFIADGSAIAIHLPERIA
ncbi:MAG: YqjF family protein [Gemmatimonadaceae bacterium]